MDVESQLWRALGVFRVVALAYELLRFAYYAGRYAAPAWGWGALAVAMAWTVVAILGDRDRRRCRQAWWRGTDLVVAVAVVALAAQADEVATVADLTIPAVWSAGAVVAAGLGRGWGSGVLAGLFIGVELVLLVGRVTAATINAVVVLCVVGGLMGWLAALARAAELQTARAAAAEARQRERERLSRAVHDGVLQVLGLVQHRGRDLGPQGTELSRLAGEQEAALRGLIARLPDSPADDATGQLDLGEVLAALGAERVTVAVPGRAVRWPADSAAEIEAAVRAALDNVRQHAGPDARAWVLLEEEDDAVVVSVRDDGVGMAPSRPADAVAEGRIGLSQSVIGRIRDLGGRAEVWSAPGSGVEVELRVPRLPPEGSG